MKVTVQLREAILSRLSRIETYIAIAIVISMRGTCRRAQVGCVITLENRIISTGYNGSLSDTHCQECDITEKCKDSIHAEANAISFAASVGIALKGATLYCTHSPCYECAKLIKQSGIKDVYYQEKYTTDDGMGLLFLRENNVSVFRYDH